MIRYLFSRMKIKHEGPRGCVPANYFFALIVVLLGAGCHSSSTSSEDDSNQEVKTPVTVTTVSHSSMNDSIELNATSTFLQQNVVKSNLNGYIMESNIKFGDYVQKGKRLFVLKTKEAAAIGNAVNRLDSSFKFSGVNVINADAPGYVMQVDHQKGDYVQDGEQLAVVSDTRSFVFVMNVPYEDKPYVSIGKQVQLLLPDNEVLNGVISSSLPMIDSASQTQQYSISVNPRHAIPKDLIARVKILKNAVQDAQTLPSEAVLTDETQTKYWVMQLINDSTAVKVPVTKGIEKDDRVQILKPQFDADTKILSGGNYGLGDTAIVIVQSPQHAPGDSSTQRKQ
ncbi:MAG TPA: efflux RND transporter periplasmic adaptor subunit [Hanamia sp.]|nr:efflux RND transporter periplasmic adaptor subunit [Hanamia sp.]